MSQTRVGNCLPAVTVEIAGNRPLESMPRGAGGFLRFLPCETRVALDRFPFAGERRLVVVIGPAVARPPIVSKPVSRSVVVVSASRGVVRRADIRGAPIVVLDNGVH